MSGRDEAVVDPDFSGEGGLQTHMKGRVEPLNTLNPSLCGPLWYSTERFLLHCTEAVH